MASSSMMKKVEMVIERVSEKEAIDHHQARTLVHKYICGGGCSWYKTKSKKAGFERQDLKAQQRKLIEEAIKEIFKGLTEEEAEVQIHEILCPGQSRARRKMTL